MPVIEGLLPAPHDAIVLDMLFALAEFHAFAKMRLHTERTLKLFEQSIKTLGEAVRKFETVTCAAYDTKELPRETAARGRREAAAKLPLLQRPAATRPPRRGGPKERVRQQLQRPLVGRLGARGTSSFRLQPSSGIRSATTLMPFAHTGHWMSRQLNQ